jgi:WD40 repeat protein
MALTADAQAQAPEKEPTRRTDRYEDQLPEGALARIGTLRLRHRWDVWSVMYAPDGKSLIAGGPAGDPFNLKNVQHAVRVWDPATGKLLRAFSAGLYGGTLALSPDGRFLACIPGAGRVLLLDAATGREIWNSDWTADDGNIINLAFSPNQKILACCGNGIQFFDSETGKPLRYFGKSKNRVGSIVFSPDGQLLASAGIFAGEIRLWQVGAGKLVQQFKGRKHSCLAFSPDGKLLAAGDASDQSTPGIVIIWDVTTGKELRRFQGHGDEIHAVVFSPDGQRLASGSRDRTVRLWDVRTGKEISRLEGHQDTVYSLTFAPDGKTLASGGGDDGVCIWDVATGKQRIARNGHQHIIDSLSFSSDGKILASGSWDGTTRLWCPTTGQEVHRLDQSKHRINAVVFSPDDAIVATASGGIIRLWQPTSGQKLRTFSAPGHTIRSMYFHPDGRQLITAGYDHTIRRWDIATGKETSKVAQSSNWGQIPVIPVAFSADARLLASGEGYDQGIIIRETASGKIIPGFGKHEHVTALAFSPEGLTLAQGSGTNTHQNIRLWDLKHFTEVRRLEGHGNGCNCLAYSTDGRMLVSGGEDEVVRLWEVVTGEEIRHWDGHDGRVNAVAFSPDCRLAASASWDKTILIWDVTDRLDNGRLRPIHLTDKQLDVCWAKLGHTASEAYSAVWTLAASKQAVPFLKERLRPVPSVSAERVTRLIAELDSDDFATRERATKDLEELEERVEAALRRAVVHGSGEVRMRASRLLEKLSRPTPPARLRRSRALAALEYCGTGEARAVLESLASGAPEGELTREAKAALDRLDKRHGN